MTLVSGAVALANPIQSPAPPKPLVSVTVTGDPGATLVALTVSTGGDAATAVMRALVAAREYPPSRNRRNSYEPLPVVGTVTVHVRVVTFAPTLTYSMTLVSGAVALANAIQSLAPPKPLVSVTVTGDPTPTVVALTVRTGAGGATAVIRGLVAART